MARVMLIVSLMLIFGVNSIAEDNPVMQREQATILLDEKGNPKELEVKFTATVTSTINVVEEINMLYRVPPSTEFNRIKLERDARLQYIATIPYADKIEYYFDIIPEKGPNIVVGSPTAPFTLNSSALSRKPQNTKTGSDISSLLSFFIILILSCMAFDKVRYSIPGSDADTEDFFKDKPLSFHFFAMAARGQMKDRRVVTEIYLRSLPDDLFERLSLALREFKIDAKGRALDKRSSDLLLVLTLVIKQEKQAGGFEATDTKIAVFMDRFSALADIEAERRGVWR